MEKAREKRGKRISLPFDYTQGKLSALRVNSEEYVAFNISYLVKSQSGAKYRTNIQLLAREFNDASLTNVLKSQFCFPIYVN